jgi:hypothetical protein
VATKLSETAPTNPNSSPTRSTRLGLFLLSAATLTFEINLTRLFSVAQFYHFAFMIVSVALLGFGASGTFLAIFPGFGRGNPGRSLGRLSLATGLSILGSYLLTNWLPFDSFSIAWERRQVVILVLHYLALAAPFFFSGLAIGSLLAAYPDVAGATYAVNLLGSALGCAIALAAPIYLGGEGTVVLSSGLTALAALVCSVPGLGSREWLTKPWRYAAPSILLLFSFIDAGMRLSGGMSLPWLELHISPYKGLSYALQYPGAEVTYRRWNSFSRVDLVRSGGVRSLPGLSYRYLEPPPPEDGLLVDADELSPVVLPGYKADFFDYLPAAIAFRLRPGANTLILEPRGGLDVLTALELGAERITAVEVNPLIIEASSHVYEQPRIQVIIDSGRSYIRRSGELYDVIVLSLANSYHPVRSGAYSLAEDYRYTVEAFHDALTRLGPESLLVVTRWVQTPPSESLRSFALAVSALERLGEDPKAQIVAFRGYNSLTLLVKNGPFAKAELVTLREFAAGRAFDLVYAPDMRLEEANRYNILPEPVYYQEFTKLLSTTPGEDYYATYPFEVSPPTDDRPFFSHFFKWSQAEQVLAELGKTWQPFGGAGYFVILALLVLSTALAALIIVLPVPVARWQKAVGQEPTGLGKSTSLPPGVTIPYLAYFGLIGLAFLLVEIPLIQRFILFLGHPAYSLTAVLFTILLFSGLGSQSSQRFPLRLALGLLVLLLLAGPPLLPTLFEATLSLPLALRLALTVVTLGPLGFLMGVPFPGGIQGLLSGKGRSGLIPWAWAVNGAASVVASVLAALLALSFGFSWVLWIGAICYAGAWLTAIISRKW